MTSLAVESVSVFGLSPVAFVDVAANVGCQHITTGLQSFGQGLLGYPAWSLREDVALRRELLAVMSDRGITLSLGDGIAVLRDVDVRDTCPRDLAIMQELGIPRINVVSLDPDLSRTFDQLGTLTELAAGHGIETLIEFVPIFPIADLPTALSAVRHVGRPDCRIMLDTMHFFRTGGRIADLDTIDPSLIGYIQLCDAPLHPDNPDYMDEAVFQREAPGDGELALKEILAALPRDRVIGLEIPLRSEALAGIGDEQRLARCVAATRAILPVDQDRKEQGTQSTPG